MSNRAAIWIAFKRWAVLPRSIVWLCGIITVALIPLWLYTASRPVGYFDSTTILGYHDSDDVVEFAYGTVTRRTCCGDGRAGRFERSANGEWLWLYESPGGKIPYRRTFTIVPGLFWLKCLDRDNPEQTWRLKRRIFAPDQDESSKGKREKP